MVRSLLSKRADLEAYDAAGATPLWLAASAGHTDCVSILLSAGARAGVQAAADGLQAASSNEHAAIKKLLEELPLEQRLRTRRPKAGARGGRSAGGPSGLLQFTRTGVAGRRAPRRRSSRLGVGRRAARGRRP